MGLFQSRCSCDTNLSFEVASVIYAWHRILNIYYFFFFFVCFKGVILYSVLYCTLCTDEMLCCESVTVTLSKAFHCLRFASCIKKELRNYISVQLFEFKLGDDKRMTTHHCLVTQQKGTWLSKCDLLILGLWNLSKISMADTPLPHSWNTRGVCPQTSLAAWNVCFLQI